MAHAGTHGASENNSDRPKLLYGIEIIFGVGNINE